ncbi:hypothetical protein FRACYDRAFT_255240 [Fragilariopsis cylindrus CCMP1102]|uniref:Uncharacterized protein n=1 Tax=Fragilariopsis cylindrus CCMP1102 TaxID=635003 RepID=A0A1E7EK64_9STRA|nr:hypothetical protein FRACYDRAFT_255240 [Fragilariopsis cylindrus CCMP1102]|eukprot:OEU06305.1 hypothetical protein FRACYDRAFT_255240 [Fragilariopsis cylindrus CCMP1102]
MASEEIERQADEARRSTPKIIEARNDSIYFYDYRTECGCHECGLTWGSRMEELAQAFVLTKLENEFEHRRQRQRLRYMYRLLRCLIQQQRQHTHGATKSRSWTARNYQVANCLYKKVMNYRSAQWLSRKESLILCQWEVLLDKLCRIDYTEQADFEIHKVTPLRRVGVYRYPLCTDSVFNEKAAFDHDISKQMMIDPNIILWKEEPRHLEKFSHLIHSPGKYFFPHEDRSHLLEIGKCTAERDHENVTSADIFMNDPLCGLQAAVCVLSDPKSLAIHGLYDKVPYPGSLFRRCKLPILSTLDEGRCLDKIRRLPYHTENKMKFLTETECGYVALLLMLLYFTLGRWVERYTGRDFSRTMMDHISIPKERRFFYRVYLGIFRWAERIWDDVCPVFLQRLFFVPQWNRRSHTDLLRHISYWRSQKCNERRSTFRAAEGRGRLFSEEIDGSIVSGDESTVQKVLIGTIVTLVSFSASSPHLFLNILTVFSCSISLGISMSLQSVESDRSCASANSSGSIIKHLNLVTVVILGFLIGQLVGSSGGVLFLAEFVVTSVSLVLGGMGTISATAMESWGIFFSLSMIASLGYLFGRSGLTRWKDIAFGDKAPTP